ncbi:hypothetical protein PIB30_092377 [Stylosanthes scabra]|uniref:Transmembrane protein n=1 Tax=Stylosanthes scabra TaxID=79078 RepID=A0ABU6XXC3_9FABA|nr:hypothetical protein [Stylosanthes scabra]
MPLDASDHILMQYARCYILYLLGGVLFPTPYMCGSFQCWTILTASVDIVGGSGVLCWLYRAMFMPPNGIRRASIMGSKSHETPHLSIGHEESVFRKWRSRRGNDDYSEARLVRYREWLDLLNIDDFKWMPYNAASMMHENFYILIFLI